MCEDRGSHCPFNTCDPRDFSFQLREWKASPRVQGFSINARWCICPGTHSTCPSACLSTCSFTNGVFDFTKMLVIDKPCLHNGEEVTRQFLSQTCVVFSQGHMLLRSERRTIRTKHRGAQNCAHPQLHKEQTLRNRSKVFQDLTQGRSPGALI